MIADPRARVGRELQSPRALFLFDDGRAPRVGPGGEPGCDPQGDDGRGSDRGSDDGFNNQHVLDALIRSSHKSLWACGAYVGRA